MGNGICSNAMGNSSKPSHLGNGIYSDAGAVAGNCICSDAADGGSFSIPGATGNGICYDAPCNG